MSNLSVLLLSILLPPIPSVQSLEDRAKETLTKLKDGRHKVRKDSREFMDFARLMLKLEGKEVTKRVDSKVQVNNLLTNSAANRGKYVRLSGRLIAIYTEQMHKGAKGGPSDVYLGIMEIQPEKKTVSFYLVELPRDANTGKPLRFKTETVSGREILDDHIEIEGIYLRIWEYEGQPHRNKKPRWIRAPLIFVKNIRLMRPPRKK